MGYKLKPVGETLTSTSPEQSKTSWGWGWDLGPPKKNGVRGVEPA